MIIFVLVYTVLLLVVANIARRFGGNLLAAFIAGASLIPAYFYFGSPFLLIYGLALGVVAFACQGAGATARGFLKASVATTAILDVLVGIPMFIQGTHRVVDEASLAMEYPFQSIEDRLTYEPSSNAHVTFDENDLGCLEKRIEFNTRYEVRRERLVRVHEHFLTKFISAPGFGVARTQRPNQFPLNLEKVEPIPLPPSTNDEWKPLTLRDGTIAPKLHESEEPVQWALIGLHTRSLVDFLNPTGFGYVKDRERVAGFQSHRFSELPKFTDFEGSEAKWWELRHLELVSLLKFDEPAVYVTDHLPRMDDLRDAPTRPLNGFERSYLDALQNGEDLAIDSNPDRIFMLGSIRAGKQCLQCHTAERGQLLGAFSYQFRRVAP
jgi:hypothetical protein